MGPFPAEPLFYLVGLSAIFLISLGKGAFGGGLLILGVPLLALVVDPVAAAIMMAPLALAGDPLALKAYPPRTWSVPDLKWLVPGMLAGNAAGYFFFVHVDPRMVGFAVGAVAIWYAARWFLRDRLRTGGGEPASAPKALFWSAIGGFTAFIAHSGVPPVMAYLLRRGLPKTVLAGTTVALFTLGNVVKFVPYFALGLRDPPVLWAALALLPAVPAGIFAGRLLHDRLDERKLYLVCYLLVAAGGAKLLFDNARALWG